MPKVKYTGFSHFRELLAEDFAKVGVEVKEALVFARHEVTEVTDEIAEAIQKLVGDEFEKVRKDTKAEVRDLTAEEPAPPQVQGADAPTTQWVTKVEEPITDTTTDQPSTTA